MLLAGLLAAATVLEAPAEPRAQWLRGARWGVMVHYLPEWVDPDREWTVEAWNEQVAAFDVAGLARQASEVGAGYVLLSIGQSSGFYLSPNATYDRLVGRRPSRCSRRDLVAELSDALAKHGVRLLVYLTAGPPSRDAEAVRALGWQGESHPNREFQRNWESVIRGWSTHWGAKVSGWWFDGCGRPNTRYRSPDPPNFATFAAAARAGNASAALAFSPGLYYPVFSITPHEDYTAGLVYDFERDLVNTGRLEDGRVDGVQLHVVSFLGRTWGPGRAALPLGAGGRLHPQGRRPRRGRHVGRARTARRKARALLRRSAPFAPGRVGPREEPVALTGAGEPRPALCSSAPPRARASNPLDGGSFGGRLPMDALIRDLRHAVRALKLEGHPRAGRRLLPGRGLRLGLPERLDRGRTGPRVRPARLGQLLRGPGRRGGSRPRSDPRRRQDRRGTRSSW